VTLAECLDLVHGIIGNPKTLTDAEAGALYGACLRVPSGGLVVEVGCQLGKSSAVITRVGRDRGYRTVHIDPYTLQPDWAKGWIEMMMRVGGDWEHHFTLLCMRTEQAEWELERFGLIDLAFIDGNHQPEGISVDLALVAMKIRPGGWLLCHDYAQPDYPAVHEHVEAFTSGGWDHVGTYDTLGAWRRRG